MGVNCKTKQSKSLNATFEFESWFEDSNLRTKFGVRSKKIPPPVGLMGVYHFMSLHLLHLFSPPLF